MLKKSIRSSILLIVGWLLAASAGAASAAEFYLRADTRQLTMPDNEVVTIWGFALDTDNNFATVDGTVTSPGPMLTLPPTDTTLTLHLKNNLPEPVSLVIPGQIATMTPVFFTDAQGRRRVRSFAAEAAANGGEATYTWINFRPGTYLYQSGSHAAVQVQMGLFGGVKKEAAAGQAYTGITHDNEAILFLSEIDPALHAAVAGGTFGPGQAMTSTVDYAPKYFLVNGQAEYTMTGVVPAIAVGSRVLVRFINAGLLTRVPLLLGSSMIVLSEDGNLSPYPTLKRDALTLLAGKTMDVMITPETGGTVMSLFDRRGYVSLGTANGGGTSTGQVIPGLPAPPTTGTVVQGGSGGGGGGGGGGGSCFIGTLLGN
jgi:FtsP/CotA-like multicopper oxidase with cupredoxin domain